MTSYFLSGNFIIFLKTLQKKIPSGDIAAKRTRKVRIGFQSSLNGVSTHFSVVLSCNLHPHSTPTDPHTSFSVNKRF